jgi:hypothetical protein
LFGLQIQLGRLGLKVEETQVLGEPVVQFPRQLRPFLQGRLGPALFRKTGLGPELLGPVAQQ